VTYVRNFTDVDDKIINRANERGMPPWTSPRRTSRLLRDMDALGIARPDLEPRVSTSMPQIIALIETLIENGLAYASEGDVYYAVDKFEGYGKLGKRTLDDMQAGARVEVSEKKSIPWTSPCGRPPNPASPSLGEPLGQGPARLAHRVLGHVHARLGPCFDIHCGGQDLIFPHHENEIAQSEGATGQDFVQLLAAQRFRQRRQREDVQVVGQFLHDQGRCAAVRARQVLRLLHGESTHYRNPINFSDAAARRGRRPHRLLLRDAAQARRLPGPGRRRRRALRAPARRGVSRRVRGPLPRGHGRRLQHSARARAALRGLQAGQRGPDDAQGQAAPQRPGVGEAAAREAGLRDTVLQLFGADPADYLERHKTKAAARRGLSLDWIAEKVGDRLIARGDKNWAEADRVRDELLAAGVVLMDGAQGTDWMVKDVRDAAPTAE
jgi:cysteinyl-tRNA synthetase